MDAMSTSLQLILANSDEDLVFTVNVTIKTTEETVATSGLCVFWIFMRNSKPLSYAHFKDYLQIQYYSLPGLCVAIGPGIKTSFYFSRIVAFTH